MYKRQVKKIDYYLGRPLCFFLSLISKIFRFKKKPSGKKILFLGISEMGSIILSYPAVKKVKELYPFAEVYFCTFRRNREILEILNITSEEKLILIEDKSLWKFPVSVLRAVLRLRKEKIEAVIDMELFSRFSAIFSYLTGAPIRVGFYRFSQEGLYRGNLHTHKVYYNPYKHISLNFLNLVNSLKYSFEEFPLLREPQGEFFWDLPKIRINEEEKRSFLSKFNIGPKNKRIVVLNLGTGQILPIRKWPLENYLELIERLTVNSEVLVVIIGLEPDEEESYLLKKIEKNPRCVSLAGKTSLREVITLFNISEIFVSHDSGLLHLGSLTSIRMIALFGPETPLLYRPLSSNAKVIYLNFACSPCFSAYNHRTSLCEDNRCLKAIKVEDVYGLVEEYLNI